ncbi:hypothetical protein [Pseudomonas sp. v388]|uniref:hypothetical protein n=1 Tax=Pseudomonas sp. v388 TaxID=2479849 RepID=UPI002114E75D
MVIAILCMPKKQAGGGNDTFDFQAVFGFQQGMVLNSIVWLGISSAACFNSASATRALDTALGHSF